MRTIDIVIMYVKGYLTNEYLIQWVREHEEELSKTYYGLYNYELQKAPHRYLSHLLPCQHLTYIFK